MRRISFALFAAFAVLLFAVGAFAQESVLAPAQPLTTGIPVLDRGIAIFFAVAGFCAFLSHFVSPSATVFKIPIGKAISWMAGNAGKELRNPQPPAELKEIRPPSSAGFARVGTLSFLVLASLFVATAAHAQSAPNALTSETTFVRASPDDVVSLAPDVDPTALASFHALASGSTFYIGGAMEADTAPSGGASHEDAASVEDPVNVTLTPAPSQFGGCNKTGTFCYAPAVSITLAAFNITTGKIEAAFSPGIGYGFTINPGSVKSIGFAAYFTMDPAAQQMSATGMVHLLNDYLRIGLSKGFVGDKSLRVPFAFGFSL